ncbi:hypothetical protein [Deinococcus sp. QL22]|uniref:hypothetical protein n=1 Tax=Deinococcus sp. QL22 TaxID=2939437 RepID=UPI002017C873|nr:hypothetical protein [Deinococcus sp. QL22]UQN08797.1 hypothetical protein M1R55_19515 [Deinococcus sp. QL22]
MTDAELAPTPAAPTPYAQAIFEFLSEEGFRPKMDDDGDVHFRCEGNAYYVAAQSGEAQYFQLVFLPFWPIEDAAERVRVHEAAAHVHNHLKVGRILVLEDNVMADVAAYFPEDQTWQGVFYRHLGGLQAVVRSFREHMRAQLEN